MINKVFISYAREDKKIASRVYRDLKIRLGHVWIDFDSILPGQRWDIAIKQAIKDSSFFIALLSTHSINKRGYVQKELRQALSTLEEFPDHDIFVIPVRIEECTPQNEVLQSIQWVDLFPDYSAGLIRIIASIGASNRKLQTREIQPAQKNSVSGKEEDSLTPFIQTHQFGEPRDSRRHHAQANREHISKRIKLQTVTFIFIAVAAALLLTQKYYYSTDEQVDNANVDTEPEILPLSEEPIDSNLSRPARPADRNTSSPKLSLDDFLKRFNRTSDIADAEAAWSHAQNGRDEARVLNAIIGKGGGKWLDRYFIVENLSSFDEFIDSSRGFTQAPIASVSIRSYLRHGTHRIRVRMKYFIKMEMQLDHTDASRANQGGWAREASSEWETINDDSGWFSADSSVVVSAGTVSEYERFVYDQYKWPPTQLYEGLPSWALHLRPPPIRIKGIASSMEMEVLEVEFIE